jgi:putative spermidine/putrescine transport system permease protein
MSCIEPECRAGWGRTLLKLSPLALPFGLLFLGGFGVAVFQSLGYGLPVPYEGGALDAYVRLLEPHFLRSFGLSLWVGLLSGLLPVCIGSALAYAFWKLPRGLQRAGVVYKVPLILPHVAVGFIVLILFSRSGWLSSALHAVGLLDVPDDFPVPLYTGGVGMILAYVYKGTPFVMLLSLAALRRMDPRLVETARMFGAGEWQVFRRVILPHLRPVMHTAFIILTLYAFGAFDIPFLLGQSDPGMLSIEVYNLYFKRDLVNRPTAMAILVCMFLFSVAFIAVYVRVAARLQAGERKL